MIVPCSFFTIFGIRKKVKVNFRVACWHHCQSLLLSGTLQYLKLLPCSTEAQLHIWACPSLYSTAVHNVKRPYLESL